MADDVLEAGPPPGAAQPPPHQPENPNLINQNPSSIVASFYAVLGLFESYGWFLLFGFVFIMIAWTNFEPAINKFLQRRKRQFDLVDTMTPEQIEARMIAMDQARLQMQEKYDMEAKERAEQRRKLEEEKRQQRIDDHDALKAGRTQSNTQKRVDSQKQRTEAEIKAGILKRNKDAKPLRSPDHSLLGGSSSSGATRWRPGAGRGPSPGG